MPDTIEARRQAGQDAAKRPCSSALSCTVNVRVGPQGVTAGAQTTTTPPRRTHQWGNEVMPRRFVVVQCFRGSTSRRSGNLLHGRKRGACRAFRSPRSGSARTARGRGGGALSPRRRLNQRAAPGQKKRPCMMQGQCYPHHKDRGCSLLHRSDRRLRKNSLQVSLPATQRQRQG